MASLIQQAYNRVVPNINTGVASSRSSSPDVAGITSDTQGLAHKADAKKKADEEAAAVAAKKAADKAAADKVAYDKALAATKALTAKYTAPTAPVVAPAVASVAPAAAQLTPTQLQAQRWDTAYNAALKDPDLYSTYTYGGGLTAGTTSRKELVTEGNYKNPYIQAALTQGITNNTVRPSSLSRMATPEYKKWLLPQSQSGYQNLVTQYNQIMGTDYTAL